jgi:hypothetical protein
LQGFGFPSRAASNVDTIIHTLFCSDGQPSVGTITKAWYRADDHSGTNSVLVSTDPYNYAVQAADVGKVITCMVTATNGGLSTTVRADLQPSSYNHWLEVDNSHPWVISPGYLDILTPVSAPSATALTTVQDLTAIRGLDLFTEHLDDTQQEMPDPPHWHGTGPLASIDFGFFSTGVTLGVNPRQNLDCPSLISPSFCVGSNHFQLASTTIEFMQPDGNRVTRTCSCIPNQTMWFVGDQFRDILIYKLSSPVTTVAPAGILSNPSSVRGLLAVEISQSRVFKGQIIDSDQTDNDVGVGYTPAADPSERIISGDSATPVMMVIDGHSILLGCVKDDNSCPNLGFYLPEITTILATAGEAPTVYALGVVETPGSGAALGGPRMLRRKLLARGI